MKSYLFVDTRQALTVSSALRMEFVEVWEISEIVLRGMFNLSNRFAAYTRAAAAEVGEKLLSAVCVRDNIFRVVLTRSVV